MRRVLALLVSGWLIAGLAPAAAAPNLTGTWSGMLNFPSGNPLLFVITIGQNGKTLSATAASPYQGSKTTAVDTISESGSALTFRIKNLDASFQGTASGSAISGTFTQNGVSVPLGLAPSSIGTRDLRGIWIGTLQTQSGSLLLGLHVEHSGGGLSATLDSPFQGAYGLPVANIGTANNSLIFSLPQIAASFGGTISGSAISGTFTQHGVELPLTFTRP